MSSSESRPLFAALVQAAGGLYGAARKLARMGRWSPALLLILLPVTAGAASAIDLPGAGFHPGWKPAGKARIYAAKNLYGYINGGAELFLEFGFTGLTVQRYGRGEEKLSLDLYEMVSADAALAVYLAKKGEERPVAGVTGRSTGRTSAPSVCITHTALAPSCSNSAVAGTSKAPAAVAASGRITLAVMPSCTAGVASTMLTRTA